MGDFAAFAPFAVSVDTFNVTEIFGLFKREVRHTQLFALIDIGRSLHHMQTGCQHLCGDFPVLLAVISESGDGSWLVVIIPEQAVPGFAV